MGALSQPWCMRDGMVDSACYPSARQLSRITPAIACLLHSNACLSVFLGDADTVTMRGSRVRTFTDYHVSTSPPKVPGAAGRFALEAPFIWTAAKASGIFEGTMEVVLCEPYPKSFTNSAAAAAARRP